MAEPLTPLGCDLRDFPKLMIDIPRLFASGFNGTASRNPLAWMIGHKLWYRSWHQVPAGSLPDDDDELCHLAELGFDTKSFAKAKALAMRGWVKCSDGRLYHPVVCEAALESWQEKLRQRLSSGNGNGKRWGVAFDPAPVAADLGDLIACLERLNPQSRSIMKARKTLGGIENAVPVGQDHDPTGTENASHCDNGTPGISSQGIGTGTGILEEESFALADSEPSAGSEIPEKPAKPPSYPPEFETAWKAYPHVRGRSSKPNASAQWRKLPPDQRDGLLAAIERFKPKVHEVCRDGGAPDMARWLRDGKHLDWLDAGSIDMPDDRWPMIVRLWRDGDDWPDRLGPSPDQPETLVPAALRGPRIPEFERQAA